MDILTNLQSHDTWQQFLAHRTENGHLQAYQKISLTRYVEQTGYQKSVDAVCRAEPFSPPRRVAISKHHSDKKRIVYIYPQEERNVLKLLTHLLQRKYDHLFCPNLYSFRPGTGVRRAVQKLTETQGLSGMWSYKVDIRDYFNSIPIERLLPKLESALADDPGVFRFLKVLLTDPRVAADGTILDEPRKGIMAGTPISTFLANLYLAELDRKFYDAGRLYARYSDDIITFAASEAELEENIRWIQEALAENGLTVNPKKESRTAPGEAFVFLGFLFDGNRVDVAPASIEKLKAKMRRKTRALMRWKARKNTTGVNAAKAFIRAFNRKLFDNPIEHELTWARWYFPLITTADSLQIIDHYSQSCIRYLATGKHTKAAYNFRYDDMKALGYISLVNCYYKQDAWPVFPEKSQETVD